LNQPIIESFNWLTPELKVVDSGRNSVKIKGVALRSNAISKNGRKYVDEELQKSARTWIGKPVTINHDMNKKAGTVEWMEHDADGNLEYVAVVNKQPYVDMIRMYGRNPQESSIRGISVEANFLHNVCPECKKRGVEKRFYSEEEFHAHMHGEHFIKTNLTSEPHGIVGQALSLVVAPEVPGVEGTTIELMETEQHGLSRLLETVIQYREEKERMSNIGIRKEGHVAVGKTGVITDGKQEVKEAFDWAKAGYTDLQDCISSNDGASSSPQEYCLAIQNGKIHPKREPAGQEKPANVEMKLGEPCSPALKACVDDLIAAGHPDASAWAICRSKLGETKLGTVSPPEKVQLTTQQTPTFEELRKEGLTEETSALQIKENRISNENNQKIEKTLNQITEALKVLAQNSSIIHGDALGKIEAVPKDDLGWREIKDDLGWKEHLEKHPQDDTSWKQKFEELKIPDIAPLEKKVAEIKIPDIAPLEKRVSEIKMPDLEPLNKDILALKDTVKILTENNKKLEETNATKTKELEVLNAEFGKLKEMFLAETKEFRGLLDVADKKVVEVTQSGEEYRKKAEAFEAKQKEQETNKVKETADLNAKVDSLKTDTDNLKDKLKPQFKGQAKEQTAKKEPDLTWKPQ
jgi:hypothetical protein